MPVEASLLALVRLVYEAATNADRLTSFLMQYAETMESAYPIIFIQGTRPGSDASVVAAAGLPDQGWLREYGEYYAARNIWWERGQRYLHPGEIHLSQLLCTPAELRRSEYYNDFLHPKDILHAIGGCIWRQGDEACVISVFRDHQHDAHDSDEVHLLATLLPHLAQALRIQARTADLQSRASWGEEGLELLSEGVMVVSLDGRLLFANAAARRVLDRRDGLRLENGLLRASTPALTASLRSLIGEAAKTSAGSGTSAGGALAIGRPSGRRPLDVVVSPLRSPACRGHAAAIVVVADPDVGPRSLLGALRRLFGLTEAEARVAERLCRGESLQDISDGTSTSLNTVRTHVKRVLMKTGTSRQAELVALALKAVAGGPSSDGSQG